MAIPLVEEPKEFYEETHIYERCVFCNSSTKYWNEYSNNPVCQICAKSHKVAELEDHGKPLRNKRRREKYKNKENK